MSMWVRVYRAAMLVCALALLLAGTLITLANQRESYQKELARALAEHAMVRQSMESTIAILTRNEGSAEQAARLSFGYASLPGATLALLNGNGEVLESTMEEALAVPFYQGGQSATLLRRDGNVRVLMVQGQISARGQKYTLLYARSLDALYAQGRRWGLLIGAGSLATMAVLALALWYVVRRSLRPLGKVMDAAERIAGGEYQQIAPSCGITEIDGLSGSLNQMAHSVNDHIEQLNMRNQAQRQLVADMAHEMKTPMSSIIGYARLLMGASVSEQKTRVALGYIASEGERLEQLSLRLMDLAKLQQGAQLQIVKVPMLALAEDALAALAPRIEGNGHRVLLDVGDDNIACDRELMVSLLVNLIDNALKYSPQGADIWVRCGPVENGLALMVCDPGHSVPPDQADMLKQPFYMLDKARTRQRQGAGLGLSLCERIAQAHGGQMVVRSDKAGFSAGIVLQLENDSDTAPENAGGILPIEPYNKARKGRIIK